MAFTDRLHNRGSISTGYDIENSAAFGGANGIQFNPSSDGNRRTWTVSLWLKRSEISTETTIFGAQNTAMVLMDPDWFRFTLYTGSTTYYFDTENGGPVYRDTSAWYNFVFQCDTTQGTAADRAKLWVNGEAVTNTNSNVIPQNTEFQLNNNTVNFNVGYFYAGNEQLDGYLADVHFTDGVANDPTEFGEFDNDSGIWKPKAYTGSYGTNGFYLEFKEPAASATGIGKDTSGNGHNFSTGGTYPSQATDTPTNNFATWQVLTGQPYAVIRNGATHYNLSGQVGWYSNVGSIAFTKGKWYAEFRLGSGITNMMAGVSQVDSEQSWNNTHLGGVANSTAYTMGFYNANGNVYTNNGSTAWGSSFPAGTVIMVAVDYKTSGVVSLYFGTNGTWANSSNPETGANNFDMNSGSPLPNNLAISFAASPYNNGGNAEANFGGFSGFSIASGNTDENGYGTFEYAPPSGYYALCTKNLAEYG